jgi:hypothetical protein
LGLDEVFCFTVPTERRTTILNVYDEKIQREREIMAAIDRRNLGLETAGVRFGTRCADAWDIHRFVLDERKAQKLQKQL